MLWVSLIVLNSLYYVSRNNPPPSLLYQVAQGVAPAPAARPGVAPPAAAPPSLAADPSQGKMKKKKKKK